jgi:hypothetical protein
VVRGGSQIPHDPEPGENGQDVIGKVDFPPKPPLIDSRLVVMVVVVPTFSTTEDGQNETVLASIAGVVPNSADDVRQGIDEEGAMIEYGGGNEKSPDQSRKTPQPIHQKCIQHGRNEVKLVE